MIKYPDLKKYLPEWRLALLPLFELEKFLAAMILKGTRNTVHFNSYDKLWITVHWK